MSATITSFVTSHKVVFGPIISRRLGISLGVNLLPDDGKLCSFDCIYCECGFNEDYKTKTKLPSKEEFITALDNKLSDMRSKGEKFDVITFAGNGEPTLHPEFDEIIDHTIEIRNKYYPEVKISVLSNAMHIAKDKVFNALKKVDNNILKLDSALIDTAKLIDRPNSPSYSIEKQIELFKKFEGNFILQTMFLKGEIDEQYIDNTTEIEIKAWLEVIEQTKPREVMIYTIDRETPCKTLEKISIDKLKTIGKQVENMGVKINIAG